MPKADEIDIVTRLRLCASGNYYSDHDPPRNQHLLNEAAALIENMHDCLDYERGVKEALAKDYARLRSLSPCEGWKLVPVEPTEEMAEAALDESGQRVSEYVAPRESGVPTDSDMSAEDARWINEQCKMAFADTYRAMLSASPSPPVSEPAASGKEEKPPQ